MVGSNYMFRPT